MSFSKNKTWNSFFVLSILLLSNCEIQAKGGGAKYIETAYNNIIFILAGIVILGVMITLLNMIFSLIELQELRLNEELGITNKGAKTTFKFPTWKKIYAWMWNLVPKEKEESIVIGHNYDGIRELDNKLPPWWLGLMYGSIIFAVVYMYYYQWGPNKWSSTQEYEIAMKKAEKQKQILLERSANKVDENTVGFVGDPALLTKGAQVFTLNCAACHGAKGEGQIGPNLTDDYWIHGGSISAIFSTIKYGVQEKGMIAWGGQLKPSTIQNLASYILTLHGTNPPNPKAPEGELYTPEEAVPVGDNSLEQTKIKTVN